MGQRTVQEGEGWRLGWDREAPIYQGLLAGEAWAFEVTAAEFEDFCRLAQQLAQQMEAMAEVLMDEERLTCEAESDGLWLEASGGAMAFDLRVIIQSGRRCEGHWPAAVTGHLLRAVAALGVDLGHPHSEAGLHP